MKQNQNGDEELPAVVLKDKENHEVYGAASGPKFERRAANVLKLPRRESLKKGFRTTP